MGNPPIDLRFVEESNSIGTVRRILQWRHRVSDGQWSPWRQVPLVQGKRLPQKSFNGNADAAEQLEP